MDFGNGNGLVLGRVNFWCDSVQTCDENLGNEELSHDDVNHCSTFKIIVLG